MIRHGVRGVPDTTDEYHDRQLPTLQGLHVP